jgi:hypothetical protein
MVLLIFGNKQHKIVTTKQEIEDEMKPIFVEVTDARVRDLGIKFYINFSLVQSFARNHRGEYTSIYYIGNTTCDEVQETPSEILQKIEEMTK